MKLLHARALTMALFIFSIYALHAQNPRLDSLAKLPEKVYNGTFTANWMGDSSAFWYSVREKGGVAVFKVDIEKGQKIRLSGEPSKMNKAVSRRQASNIVPSPDSLWEAYAKDNNLWVRRVEDKTEYQLSFDGTSGMPYALYGMIVWSPDSRGLATVKTVLAKRHIINLLESSPKDQVQPRLQTRDYFKPGDVIDVTLPALFDVHQMREIPLATDPFRHQFNLRLNSWSVDGKSFTFEFNERGHQLYKVVRVDGQTGAMTTIIEERAPTSFIYYNRNFRHDTPDGKHIIWISERDGWRHLYRFDAQSGKLINQITKGEWVVREVEFVDDVNKSIIFRASGLNGSKGEDPYNIHICRVNFDGSGFADLTPENANHKAQFSPDKRYFVDTYSRPDLPPTSVVRQTSNGKVVMELEKADISELISAGWRAPEVFKAKGRDGRTDIWGNIYRPMSFDQTKDYPIIEYIYAGPHDAFVNKNFTAFERYCSRLAELGFVVVTIDGMGTANRSKAFHDVCWRNLKDAGFPDRIAWIKAAAEKYKYMDTSRVGIYGFSAGGQSALGALLFHGDFYKVAVSLCGCHDNRMDKIWWNEQWMGYPVGPWYEESSNVANAHRLQGRLLIINGELDDNVDPASSLQVVRALVKADKDFEQFYLPGYGHGLGGKFETRQVENFFVKNL